MFPLNFFEAIKLFQDSGEAHPFLLNSYQLPIGHFGHEIKIIMIYISKLKLIKHYSFDGETLFFTNQNYIIK